MTKVNTLFASLILMLSVHVTNAQEIKFTEFDLSNGLHVILYPDNSAPSVTVGVHYNVGSKNENPELTGFAHFFEHLMFEGTKNIPRGNYSKLIEKAGGTLNAYTMVDKTYYHETVPSNQLELALWMESERMLHAKVDSTGIATQKRVVAEEKKQRYDSRPYGDWMNIIMEKMFKTHPYRWTTIGDVEKLMNAKDEDFVNFYNTYYVPNNACLVIAGDFESKTAEEFVRKYFSDIPKGTKPMFRPNAVEPPIVKEIRDTVYRDIQLPMIIHGYRIPSAKNDDSYAIQLLSDLLSNGQSSKLYKRLVDEEKTALAINSFNLNYQDPSISVILGISGMGIDPAIVDKAFNEEVQKLCDNLISERELEKLKNQKETELISSLTSKSTIADKLAENYIYYNNTNLINEEEAKWMSITREDIQRVAKKYFNKNNRVVICYFPKNMENK